MLEGSRYAHVAVGDREKPIKVLFEVTELEPAVQTSRSGEIARSSELGESARGTRTLEIGRGDGMIEDGLHLEDICRKVNEVVGAVMSSMKALETKRTVLEFGVEIAADTGGLTALIVRGSGKANLKITAEW
jgi:hypothetical protein